MNPLDYFVDLLADAHTLVDVVAIPKLVVADLRIWAARWVLDRTEVGKTIVSELAFRYHLERARELRCDGYCLIHACDVAMCPEGVHGE